MSYFDGKTMVYFNSICGYKFEQPTALMIIWTSYNCKEKYILKLFVKQVGHKMRTLGLDETNA